MPTMQRSSSSVFQAVVSPCVPVNTPPSGGPTSSPKMSVTPSRVSPTWSAMRMAWIIVAMSGLALAADEVLVREDVLPHRAGRRVRLAAHHLAGVEQLLRVRGAQLIDPRARDELAILERGLEALEAIDLAFDQVGAAGRRVAAQAGHHGLEEVRLWLGAHVVGGGLQR